MGRMIVIAGVLLSGASAAEAGPQGAREHPDWKVTRDDKTTIIEQYEKRVLIEWDSFDIEHDETVRFRQLGKDWVALNHVPRPEHPSSIDGTLKAEGNVWIVNPAGVLFGPGARVQVGGLYPVAADLKGNFQRGITLSRPVEHPDAEVALERGARVTIREAGLAALVAPNVRNQGVIRARTRPIVIEGADEVAVDFRGDGLLSFMVEGARLADARDAPPGDAILMTAGAADAVVGGLVAAGATEARSVKMIADGQGRTIVLGDGFTPDAASKVVVPQRDLDEIPAGVDVVVSTTGDVEVANDVAGDVFDKTIPVELPTRRGEIFSIEAGEQLLESQSPALSGVAARLEAQGGDVLVSASKIAAPNLTIATGGGDVSFLLGKDADVAISGLDTGGGDATLRGADLDVGSILTSGGAVDLAFEGMNIGSIGTGGGDAALRGADLDAGSILTSGGAVDLAFENMDLGSIDTGGGDVISRGGTFAAGSISTFGGRIGLAFESIDVDTLMTQSSFDPDDPGFESGDIRLSAQEIAVEQAVFALGATLSVAPSATEPDATLQIGGPDRSDPAATLLAGPTLNSLLGGGFSSFVFGPGDETDVGEADARSVRLETPLALNASVAFRTPGDVIFLDPLETSASDVEITAGGAFVSDQTLSSKTGDIRIEAARVELTGPAVTDDGAFTMRSGGPITVEDVSAGAGPITIESAVDVTVRGALTTTAPLAISAGEASSLRFAAVPGGASAVAGDITLSGGEVALEEGASLEADSLAVNAHAIEQQPSGELFVDVLTVTTFGGEAASSSLLGRNFVDTIHFGPADGAEAATLALALTDGAALAAGSGSSLVLGDDSSILVEGPLEIGAEILAEGDLSVVVFDGLEDEEIFEEGSLTVLEPLAAGGTLSLSADGPLSTSAGATLAAGGSLALASGRGEPAPDDAPADFERDGRLALGARAEATGGDLTILAGGDVDISAAPLLAQRLLSVNTDGALSGGEASAGSAFDLRAAAVGGVEGLALLDPTPEDGLDAVLAGADGDMRLGVGPTSEVRVGAPGLIAQETLDFLVEGDLIADAPVTAGTVAITTDGDLGVFAPMTSTSANTVILNVGGELTVAAPIAALAGTGDTIVIRTQRFINTFGEDALDPGAGRFLVWSVDPVLDDWEALIPPDQKRYGRTFASGASPAEEGDLFLFERLPVLRLAADDLVYAGGNFPDLSFSAIEADLIDGDSLSVALTGEPDLATDAEPGVPFGRYPILISPGDASSPIGYDLDFLEGAAEVVGGASGSPLEGLPLTLTWEELGPALEESPTVLDAGDLVARRGLFSNDGFRSGWSPLLGSEVEGVGGPASQEP